MNVTFPGQGICGDPIISGTDFKTVICILTKTILNNLITGEKRHKNMSLPTFIIYMWINLFI